MAFHLKPLFAKSALSLALAAGLFAGCSRRTPADAKIESLKDLEGRTCACVLGTAFEEILSREQSGILYQTYNDTPSAIEAIRLGKSDVLPMDTVIARRWVSERPDALRILLTFGHNPYGYFLAKGSPLYARVNAAVRNLKASGEFDRIIDKWCAASDLGTVRFEPRKAGVTGQAGVLRFATTGEYEPGSFLRDGTFAGFDIDIARRIADELDMNLELVSVNMSSLVPSVQSGKADFGGGCITITESRREKVDFTDCYLDDGFALLGRVPKASEGVPEIRTAADLKGRRVAHMSSDFHKKELLALQPDIIFDPYTEYAFAVESLRKGKIDAISLGKTFAEIWTAKFPGEFKVAFDYADDVCCFLLSKNSPLKQKFDAELRKMNAAGETAAIVSKWIEGAKNGTPPPMWECKPPPLGAPVIRVACAAQAEPWCFVADLGLAGADIEILQVIAQRLGWNLKPKTYSWGGMVDCVNAGRCEIACGGIYTAGRTFPTVDASEKYADEKMCLLVRDAAFKGGESGLVAFAKSLKGSFVRTFVTEDRWRMLANGFGITLLITFLASLLGTALAFPVWLARTSRLKAVSRLARVYIATLQGTPVLVLLMILFYIVFGQVDIDGLWVAVIGFGLNLSAYAGEMLRSGVDSVPRGQTEAALALGYTPRRAFVRFVLPQAVRAVLPVYRGELIGLLKMTSIVGYIAIGDLTKASDLVRSRTYESFFPIITTALVYFVASWLLASALERFGRRLDPASSRVRKGGASCR